MRQVRRAVSFSWMLLAAMLATVVPGAAQSPPPEAGPAPATQAQMDGVFGDFFKVGLDLSRPFTVHDLRIKRDTMELTLGDGVLLFAQPVGGKVSGAYFSGTGTIRVTLPNAIDRKLLKAAYGKPLFEEAIGEAVLRFNDATEKEILAAAKPGGTTPGDVAAVWGDREKIDYNSTGLQMDYLENALNGFAWASFFTAEVRVKDGKEWYGFRRSGRERIENVLVHERAMGSAGKRWYEILSMYHRPEDYDAKGNYDLMPASDAKETAALRHVEMEIVIPNTKTVNIDARLTVESLRDGLRAVRFDLLNNLGDAWYETKGLVIKVEMVAGPSGDPAPYVHGCDELLVLLPRPLAKGEKAVIHVKATENTIIELTDKSYWIYTDSAWFPKIGPWGGRFTFDWTFKVAKPMRAVSSGDTVREWAEGDLNCGRYASEVPARLPSFIFGELKPTDGSYKREGAGGEVVLRMYTVLGGAFHFKGKPENILYNIGQGLKTYESAFGPYAFKEMDVAEMAPQVGFGQSPSGILLLPAMVAGTSGGGGETDQFIYHELAHQWWGHNVGSVGLEDDWISESWAEYSSGLITEAIDAKKFLLMRDEWKRKAIETDKYGTIATAYRSNTVEYGAARTNLLYSKGPCVIHMLRTWMGWEKFSKYVNTIQTRYRGMEINTDTLAREASSVMGYDMFPFFDQWVRDKGIPKVHYSWTVASEADGRKLVTIKVRQEDEENPKILMVPIALDFGKGEPTIVQKPVLNPKVEIQLRVPMAPRNVTLDPDASQLATFVAETTGK